MDVRIESGVPAPLHRRTRASVPEGEKLFLLFLLIAVLLQLEAFLWIYTGAGNYKLSDELSAGAQYYSRARQIVLFLLIIYLFWSGSVWRLSRLAWPMLLFSGYFLLSVTWSEYPIDSLRAFSVFAMQVVVGFAFCARADEQLVLNRLKWLAISMLAINLAFGALFPDLATEPGGFSGIYLGAFRGIFSHKNSLGAIAALCITLITAAAIRGGRFQPRLGNAATLFLFLALLLSTNSGTGIATASIVLVVYFMQFGIMRRLPLWARLILMVVTLIIIVIVAASPDFIVNAIGTVLERDSTFTGRTFLWNFALIMGERRPILGYGFAGFWQPFVGPDAYLSRIGLWEVYQAHNGFIEAYLFGGIVGFALTVGLFLYLIGKTISVVLRDPSSPTGFFALCVTLQVILQNLSESYFPNQMELAGTLVTISIVLLRQHVYRQEARGRVMAQ